MGKWFGGAGFKITIDASIIQWQFIDLAFCADLSVLCGEGLPRLSGNPSPALGPVRIVSPTAVQYLPSPSRSRGRRHDWRQHWRMPLAASVVQTIEMDRRLVDERLRRAGAVHRLGKKCGNYW